MPQIILTPKEINLIVQLIRLGMESGEAYEYAKKAEVNNLRDKLQKVKD